MSVKWVMQEDPSGCMIACLAMIRGVSYQDVKKHFSDDFQTHGIPEGIAYDYLSGFGYTVIYRRVHCYNDPKEGHKHITEPFAPIHLVVVRDFADSDHNHGVVMLDDGTIFNPKENGVLNLANFFEVISIAGVWKP